MNFSALEFIDHTILDYLTPASILYPRARILKSFIPSTTKSTKKRKLFFRVLIMKLLLSDTLWNAFVCTHNSSAARGVLFSGLMSSGAKESGEMARWVRGTSLVNLLAHSWWGRKPRTGWSRERLEGIFIAAVQHVHSVQAFVFISLVVGSSY